MYIGLASMRMSSKLPSITEKLIGRIDMTVSLTDLINVPFTLDLYNAVDADLLVTSIDSEIHYEGKHIATVTEHDLHILIPAKTSITSPNLHARSDLKHAGALTDLLEAGEGPLDVYNTMVATVGDFPVKLPYDQLQVPAYIHSG